MKLDHSTSQTDLPLEKQVLNISVNMARIAYWTADSLQTKKQLIGRFMEQTNGFLTDLKNQDISDKFIPTLERFKKEFNSLKSEEVNEENKLIWAERALTWANILQHRARLA